jgi:hypothetical protein
MKEAQLYQLELTPDELAILAAMHLITKAVVQGKGGAPLTAVLVLATVPEAYISFVEKLGKLTTAGIKHLEAQNEAQASA